VFSLGLSAAVLAGCMTPPKVDPQVSAVAAPQLGLSQLVSPPAQPRWWAALGDPQLDALMDRALAQSPTLDAALARLRLAQAQAIAAGAARQPQISADGSLLRERLSENYTAPPKSLGVGAGGGGVYWFGDAQLGLSWDLDFWGRQAAQLRAAQSQVLAADLDRESARLALSGAIVQAYVDLYRDEVLADIAADTLRQRESLLRLARARQAAGLDTEVEVRNAEALVPQARLAQLVAQQQRDLVIHKLAALSAQGADAYAGMQRPQLQLDAALPLPASLPLDLLARRPDVLAARARIEAATAGRSAARAAYYPDISLNAFAGLQSISLDKLFEASSGIWGVGPALHLPLFDGHALDADYRGASAQLDAAVADYNGTVLDAVRDVSDQLTNTQALAAQRAQIGEALNAAQAAYELAVSRYKAGLSSQLTVLNAETQLLSLRANAVALDANRLLARVSLLLTVGGSFEPPVAPTSPDASPASAGAGV
jgi:NodT family efflux transporter outer membrane factor (OMF) lipoprotein